MMSMGGTAVLSVYPPFLVLGDRQRIGIHRRGGDVDAVMTGVLTSRAMDSVFGTGYLQHPRLSHPTNPP